MVKGKPNDAFNPNAKPKRIARPKTAPKMDKIPKGAPEPKKDVKAEEAAARKRAKLESIKHEPHQYVAMLTTDVIKALRENGGAAYNPLKEKEQQAIIGLIENAAEKVIRKVIYDMAAQGYAHVAVKIGPVKFNDDKTVSFGIKSMAATPAAHEAARKIGTEAMLLLCDPQAYIGGEIPKADKDQLDLTLPQPESDAYLPFEVEPENDFGDDEEI